MASLSLGIFVIFAITGWIQFSFPVTSESTSNIQETQTITTNCTYKTKRIWVICSNSEYLSAGRSLNIQVKETVVSKTQDPVAMNSCKTFKGGSFYYFDVAKSTECFRIESIQSPNLVVYKTDWVCDIKTSLVYEITPDVSAGIRSRTTDVEDKRHPDAQILALLLSSYITFDSSYENGYGGYAELKDAWISKYIGNYGTIVGPDLSNTFIYDYTKEEYENRYIDDKKTRKLSVSDKITELSNAYSTQRASVPLVSKRDKWISILALAIAGLTAGGLLVATIVIDKKHGNKTKKQS